MWLFVAPRAAKVLMVQRASGSSRLILASALRYGAVPVHVSCPPGRARPAPDKTDRFIRVERDAQPSAASASLPRLTFSMMPSGSAVQTKGLGHSLASARKRFMAA